MTITDALIEKVARRMCVAEELDPDAQDDGIANWKMFRVSARVAVVSHIALAEIMPPDRATLLAVADAAGDVGGQAARTALAYEDPYAPEASAWDRHAQLWIEFSEVLRAKAGKAGE